MNDKIVPISGYRKLSDAEVALVNAIKALAAEVGKACDTVDALEIAEGFEACENPRRACAIARTELQTGFMWLIRAVTRPKGF
jgi:hypothetical protein